MSERIDVNALEEGIIIASDPHIADILRPIKDNVSTHLCIDESLPQSAIELESLGHLIGKNISLEELELWGPLRTGVDFDNALMHFAAGMSSNRSIGCISFSYVVDGGIFKTVSPFLRNNNNLTSISLDNCNLGEEGCKQLAGAIGECKSLEWFDIDNDDEHVAFGTVDHSGIIVALGNSTQLEDIIILGCNLGVDGCRAFSSLSRLERLHLENNGMGDEEVKALTDALQNNTSLSDLDLSGNPAITIEGWKAFSEVLKLPKCNIEDLYLDNNNIGDDEVEVFAGALTNNCKLSALFLCDNDIGDEGAKKFASALTKNCTVNTLYLHGNNITYEGWEPFLRLVCDLSSVSSTFGSNHTLHTVTTTPPMQLAGFLRLNHEADKRMVTTIKILWHHRFFNMQPIMTLFDNPLKSMPRVISWFDTAASYQHLAGKQVYVQEMKFSAIYQFIRGNPVMYVDSRKKAVLKEMLLTRLEELDWEEEESIYISMRLKQLNE